MKPIASVEQLARPYADDSVVKRNAEGLQQTAFLISFARELNYAAQLATKPTFLA